MKKDMPRLTKGEANSMRSEGQNLVHFSLRQICYGDYVVNVPCKMIFQASSVSLASSEKERKNSGR